MPYAIVQKSLEAPSVEQLVRAFRVLPDLVDADAAMMAKDAFGILVEGLDMADAGRLLQALHAEGVEAEMVDHKNLPPLPPAKPIRRAECRPDAFVAYDHLDRAQAVEWPHVILLAAGAVRLTEFKHVVKERVVYRRTSPRGAAVPVTKTEHSDREEQTVRLILELFLDVAPGRCHIAAEKFNYGYLGDRMQPKRMQNYVALVEDCLAGATGAVLNRGAQRLRESPNSTLQYPTRHAFEEESVWLLWRHFGSGKDLA